MHFIEENSIPALDVTERNSVWFRHMQHRIQCHNVKELTVSETHFTVSCFKNFSVLYNFQTGFSHLVFFHNFFYYSYKSFKSKRK